MKTPEGLPILVIDKSSSLEETENLEYTVVDINLKNNLTYKNRPAITLVCLGAPKKNNKLRNIGDKIKTGEGLNKGDNPDEEEHLEVDSIGISIAVD